MKTRNKTLILLMLLFMYGTGLTSCSKEETQTITMVDTDGDGILDTVDKCPSQAAPGTADGCPVSGNGTLEEGEGISENELEVYHGDIGLVIDARKVAKKGYRPTKVRLEIEAQSDDYSQTLDLNEYALMGQLKLAIEDLSTEAEQELKDGVQVTATLLDKDGALIVTESLSKQSFLSNPSPITIQGNDLEDLNTEVDLIPDTPYYIQWVREGEPQKGAFYSSNTHSRLEFDLSFSGNEDNMLYYFEKWSDTHPNAFNIKHKASNTYLKQVRSSNGTHRNIESGYNNPHQQNHVFVIKKVADGEYSITDLNGVPIKSANTQLGLDLEDNSVTFQANFRFVPMNIDWNIENIATEYLQPILPPANSGFSFNNTLINCGTGELSQTIGTSKTVETVTTVGWEESVSISSSHSAGVSIGMSMEVSGSFFGNGATYKAEASASYDYTTTNTTENTNWQEATGTTSETFFSERTITVPPKSASLVYDAFQSYNNVKVNLVKRLRVKATEHDTGTALTGDEISTQFHFNGFEGHITEIGADYIEVTLRAVATMDEIFESKSDVQEVDPKCSN
ncbi:MAG: hypothetical protein AB3N16_13320 [Flavobacteriaceae bacterium]